jgi:hypothetical protein
MVRDAVPEYEHNGRISHHFQHLPGNPAVQLSYNRAGHAGVT